MSRMNIYETFTIVVIIVASLKINMLTKYIRVIKLEARRHKRARRVTSINLASFKSMS